MNIPKVSELEIIHVDTTNWPDFLICHCCGKKMPNKEVGCFAATIDIAPDATVDFHFCSSICVNDFKEHPLAQDVIDDIVKKAIRIHNK